MVDSNPDLNSSPQESGQPHPDANQQVSPEHITARTEATRIQEAEKRGGPGEALQELVAGQLPGEIITTTAAGKVYGEELGRNDLTDAQRRALEGGSALVQQRSAQISEMQGELSTLSANLGGVVAKREAETPPVEGPTTPIEASEDAPAVKVEVTETPLAATVEEEEPPTPPEEPPPPEPLTPYEPERDPEPSENLIKMAEQVKASQEAAKAKRDEYKVMSRDQLQDEITELNEGLAGYQGILTGARGLSAGDREYIFREMANARAELVEIRRAIADKQRVASERQIFDELRGRVKTSVESAANMTGFTTDQLKEAAGKYKSSEEILKASINAEAAKGDFANQDLLKVYRLELNDATARAKESQRLFEEKDKEAKAKEAEEETIKTSEALEQKRRETATVANLQTAVSKDDIVVNTLITRINDLDRRIAQATGKDKINLEKERANLTKEELTARETLEADKEALKSAEERERNEKGLGQSRSEKTVRVLTQAEFDQLDASDKVKYLMEVANAVKSPDDPSFRGIRDKLKAGDNLTFKEAGELIRKVSDSLFEKGKTRESMEVLHQALTSQPEVAQAILDRVTQREDVKKAVDEMYPGMGKKILDFARKHPGWLAILLTIIAAGATVVTVGAGPVLGVGAGATGVASGGFGISKKSRW